MSAQEALDAIFREDAAPLGAVIGIARDGHQDIAAGGASASDGAPMTTATAFDVASVTKVAATSSALLRLVTLGALGFDDPVARYLPQSALPAGTSIRHLLQHRAGLWEWQPLYLAQRNPWEQIDTLPLRYRLGEGRNYSDLGFMLLGRIVSAAAGAPLDQAVRERSHAHLLRPGGWSCGIQCSRRRGRAADGRDGRAVPDPRRAFGKRAATRLRLA